MAILPLRIATLPSVRPDSRHQRCRFVTHSPTTGTCPENLVVDQMSYRGIGYKYLFLTRKLYPNPNRGNRHGAKPFRARKPATPMGWIAGLALLQFTADHWNEGVLETVRQVDKIGMFGFVIALIWSVDYLLFSWREEMQALLETAAGSHPAFTGSQAHHPAVYQTDGSRIIPLNKILAAARGGLR